MSILMTIRVCSYHVRHVFFHKVLPLIILKSSDKITGEEHTSLGPIRSVVLGPTQVFLTCSVFADNVTIESEEEFTARLTEKVSDMVTPVRSYTCSA